MCADGADKGIIPLTTSELFRRVEEKSATDPKLSYTVEVSYIEIYNEKSALLCSLPEEPCKLTKCLEFEIY